MAARWFTSWHLRRGFAAIGRADEGAEDAPALELPTEGAMPPWFGDGDMPCAGLEFTTWRRGTEIEDMFLVCCFKAFWRFGPGLASIFLFSGFRKPLIWLEPSKPRGAYRGGLVPEMAPASPVFPMCCGLFHGRFAFYLSTWE